ncbi:hypothetical protein [Prevotella sp.]|uniref:hypothetical protein n=1 Tax=Prevotella sp. TaxID=59823 RepID=UPI0027E3A59D|nr:hypothetical protein [Prevotella sp.]
MNTVLDDKEKREGVVTQPGVVAPGVLAQPQQPANVFSGKRPATFENMPVTVGWTPNGKPVTEGSNVQQSWQRSNPSNMEGSMPAAYALNSKPLGGVDLGAVGGDKGGTAVFEKDDSQMDGGFFKWLGGLSKKRPGRREGESDDDYDERMTRNNMRIATLADAIRHMGNIYNTSKGAVPQKFNSPTAEMQAGLDKRKAERAKKAAAEADAAYKDANLQIKMDAADADRAYKGQMLELKRSADKRADQNAKDLNEYRKGILGVQQGNLKLAGERLGETKRHNRATEGISASRLALAQSRAARGGSGNSGGADGGYGYATPYGRLTSKNQLTPQQEAQVWTVMRNLGMITPQKQRELDRAMNGYEGSDGKMVAPSSDRASKVIQSAISYGLLDNSSKGALLRRTFREGFGYADVRTSDTAQRGVNTSGRKVGYVTKMVAKSKANQIREQRKGASPIKWQGSGSKPKTQSKGGTAKGKGTDWSQYVK